MAMSNCISQPERCISTDRAKNLNFRDKVLHEWDFRLQRWSSPPPKFVAQFQNISAKRLAQKGIVARLPYNGVDVAGNHSKAKYRIVRATANVDPATVMLAITIVITLFQVWYAWKNKTTVQTPLGTVGFTNPEEGEFMDYTDNHGVSDGDNTYTFEDKPRKSGDMMVVGVSGFVFMMLFVMILAAVKRRKRLAKLKAGGEK